MLGVVRHQQGRGVEALDLIGSALTRRPRSAEALSNYGTVLHQFSRNAEALASYDQALTIRPDYPEALLNRGNVLMELKRLDDALASYDKALVLRPDYPEALLNRGNVLMALERLDALASYDRALTLRPDYFDALSNRGNLLRKLKRFEEALASCDRALALKAASAETLNNRGIVLRELTRLDEALVSYQQALAVEPNNGYALSGVLDVARQTCNWGLTARLAGQLEAHVKECASAVWPFTLLCIYDDPAMHLAAAKKYIRGRVGNGLTPLRDQTVWRNDRIRIAYLSSDFHTHATAFLTAELFERHDRSRFEVVGVSFGGDDDSDMRARLVRAFDQFHDVRGKSDLAVANHLAELEIDIAVDLKGYTQNSRPVILAHRPAPIQVSYLGYPGTTGADFIDYVIADPVVLPFDQQPFYTEQIVHLPECYQVNDSKRKISEHTPTRLEAGLPEQGFVFCCFNNNYKITAPIFDVWMRLLAAVENSVLWLVRGNPAAEVNLRKEAAAREIDPVRLVFADRQPLADHLARHRLADLFLDTLPVNAHTTASDALWAGLPVLTCRGRAFAGRVAASLLGAIGLPELATDSLEDYEASALRLARDSSALAALRVKLARNRLTHPLFDTDRFCRHIETTYTTMWETWQRGDKPRSFTVDPQQDIATRPPMGRLAGEDGFSAPHSTSKRLEIHEPLKQVADGRGTSRQPINDPSGVLDQAIAFHQNDQLVEAERLYLEILETQPDQFDALHLLGVVRHQQERDTEALDLIEAALSRNPEAPSALSNRGAVLQRLGRHQDALASYEQALALQPNEVQAFHNRGTVLERLGRLEEAVASYEQALTIRPDYLEALYNRGNLLMQLQRLDEALASYDQTLAVKPDHIKALDSRGCVLLALKRPDQALKSFDRALSLRPDFAAAAFNRGNALRELKRFEEAVASYNQALETQADNPGVLNNRGNVLLELKRYEEALASYEQALTIRSDYIEALNNRGIALKELGLAEEAVASYERALEIRPDYADAFNNRGNALLELGRIEEALKSYDRSIDIDPENAEYRFNRSLVYLLVGPFDEGWREYEWRRKRKSWIEKEFKAPEWAGEPISGKRLLLYSEQGLGDTIHFARFARSVTKLGVQIILEVQAALGGLAQGLDGAPVIVRRGEQLPEFDFHLPLVSAPLVLGLVPQHQAAEGPYLSADPVRVNLWSSRLPRDGLRVGIAWQGNPSLATDRSRSISLKAFAPLAQIPGVTLISLQKNTGVEQLADLPSGMVVETLGPNFDAGPDAFVDTATVMMNLDLIISCDTAVAHLAGALGCPVWILLRHVPDWRWMMDREDTPWYPTARLFRQSRPGDWDGVLGAVAAELQPLAANPDAQPWRRYDPNTVSAPESAEAFYARANILKGWGQLDEALTNYDRALSVEPAHVDALNRRGVLLADLKRFEEALASYDRALSIRADHADVLSCRGYALWALGRFGEALQSYDQSLAIRPSYPEALNGRAGTLLELKRLDDALASYDEALRIHPRYADALYGRGVILAQLGRIEDAVESYERALVIRPDYPEALNNQGAGLSKLGRLEDAVASYDRALAFRPDDVIALTNRANALMRLGRHEDALTSTDRALMIQPDFAAAAYRRGMILKELQRFEDALASFDKVVVLKPDHAAALCGRGFVLVELGHPDEALASYDRALAIRPDYIEALNNRGCVLKALGRPEEALASYDRALAIRADYADALYNRGTLLFELNRYEEALASFDRALAIRPGYVEALSNRGCALKEQGRPEEALENFDRALTIRPDNAGALNNRGCTLLELMRFQEALASYDRSVDLDPQNAEYHNNRSLLLLMLGSFEEGWREYEWRRKRKSWEERKFQAPEWAGEPISGKRLLLYGEQGLGDTIQFARFVRSLTALGAMPILEVQPPLGALLRRLDGQAIIVRQNEELPDFDLQLPLLSVPFALGYTPDQNSPAPPYLSADPDRVEFWSRRLPTRGFRVGIAWQGNPLQPTDKARSIPLRAFASLARLAGIVLVSLQKDAGVDQLAALPLGMVVESLGVDFDAGRDAFLDTAAVMMNLDLVITCDTAVAHLAGALGRPVWIMLKQVPDWRWMLDREDSPWYPTARLFRQTRAGDWDEVLARVAVELVPLAANIRKHSFPDAPGPLSAPLSFGELIDKITILQIKTDRIADPGKLANVRRELELLTEARQSSGCNVHDTEELERELRRVNEQLWDIEDRIRDCERKADFGPGFIDLARAVYKTNDLRAALKRRINETVSSELVEEKSYHPSQPVATVASEPLPGYGITTGEQAIAHQRVIDTRAVGPILASRLVPEKPAAARAYLEWRPSTNGQWIEESRLPVIFVWGISNRSGWGMVGLNLAFSWAEDPHFMPVCAAGFSEDHIQLDDARRQLLATTLENSRSLQAKLARVTRQVSEIPYPVLSGLGNRLVAAKAVHDVDLRGSINIGRLVFEDSEIDNAARQRAESYSLLVVISNWNKELLQSNGIRTPVALTFEGVDPTLFHPAAKRGLFKNRFVIFSGGKLEHRKGQDLVLLAFRAFRDRHPEALLVSAWHSPWPALAASLASNQRVVSVPLKAGAIDAPGWAAANGIPADSFVDIGPVPNPQMPPILHECDVGLFPNRAEGGTNLVAMECMACGVPCILSANTGHLDLIQSENCLALGRQGSVTPVPPYRGTEGWGESDVEEIVEALETLWQDRQRAETIGGAGRSFIAERTWSSHAANLKRVLLPYLSLRSRSPASASRGEEIGQSANVAHPSVRVPTELPQLAGNGSSMIRDWSHFDAFLDRLAKDVYPEPPAEPAATITRTMINDLWQEGLIKPGFRVLDIGCGQGGALEHFQRLGLCATGITLGSDFDICRASGFDVVQMDHNFMSFNDNEFDFLWCRHVLEHSVVPLFTLTEYRRITKPMGLVYVEVPAPDTSAHHEANPNHYSVLTRAGWLSLFRRAGFTVERSVELGVTVPCGPDTYWVFLLRSG
jgi:predicted O-linked N-acetylglucosamine transferase (SPINDLY family)/glycosyltransferase involved in cell wall biosynthesis/SAM-dependent methyltransferase